MGRKPWSARVPGSGLYQQERWPADDAAQLASAAAAWQGNGVGSVAGLDGHGLAGLLDQQSLCCQGGDYQGDGGGCAGPQDTGGLTPPAESHLVEQILAHRPGRLGGGIVGGDESIGVIGWASAMVGADHSKGLPSGLQASVDPFVDRDPLRSTGQGQREGLEQETGLLR